MPHPTTDAKVSGYATEDTRTHYSHMVLADATENTVDYKQYKSQHNPVRYIMGDAIALNNK